MNYYCQFWQYYLFDIFIVIFKWIIIAGNGNNYACAVFLSLFGMDDLSGFTDMDMEFRQFSRGCTIFLVPMNVLTNTSLESQDPWQSSYGARFSKKWTAREILEDKLKRKSWFSSNFRSFWTGTIYKQKAVHIPTFKWLWQNCISKWSSWNGLSKYVQFFYLKI